MYYVSFLLVQAPQKIRMLDRLIYLNNKEIGEERAIKQWFGFIFLICTQFIKIQSNTERNPVGEYTRFCTGNPE